jgi:hypothetical protein
MSNEIENEYLDFEIIIEESDEEEDNNEINNELTIYNKNSEKIE